MSEQSLEQKVIELDRKVKILIDNMPGAVTNLADLGQREHDGRVEMCLTLYRFIVKVTNSHCHALRRIAELPALAGSSDVQSILGQAAALETECEHLEKLLFDNSRRSNS